MVHGKEMKAGRQHSCILVYSTEDSEKKTVIVRGAKRQPVSDLAFWEVVVFKSMWGGWEGCGRA